MILYFLSGVQAGLVLALLVGPLVVLLIQLSIRRGTLASFAAAVGIWTSDLLMIMGAHYGLGGLNSLVTDSSFVELIGTMGGLILLVTAYVMWRRRPVRLDSKRIVPKRGLARAWAQGFTLNTFNPFTIAFWSFFTMAQVHDPGLLGVEALAVYAGIFFTIVLTDSAKVLGARKLREWLRPGMMVRVQRVGALAIGIFGVLLLVRVWW